MVEERSFENPEFTRRVARAFVTVIGLGVTIYCLSYFVTAEWTSWPRILAHSAGIIAVFVIVDLAFYKFAGLPMRPWFKLR